MKHTLLVSSRLNKNTITHSKFDYVELAERLYLRGGREFMTVSGIDQNGYVTTFSNSPDVVYHVFTNRTEEDIFAVLRPGDQVSFIELEECDYKLDEEAGKYKVSFNPDSPTTNIEIKDPKNAAALSRSGVFANTPTADETVPPLKPPVFNPAP